MAGAAGFVIYTTSEGGLLEVTRMTRLQYDKFVEEGVAPDGHTMLCYAAFAPESVRGPVVNEIRQAIVADHDFILGRPRDVVPG